MQKATGDRTVESFQLLQIRKHVCVKINHRCTEIRKEFSDKKQLYVQMKFACDVLPNRVLSLLLDHANSAKLGDALTRYCTYHL